MILYSMNELVRFFQMVEPVVNGLDVWNMQLLLKQMWRYDIEATTAN